MAPVFRPEVFVVPIFFPVKLQVLMGSRVIGRKDVNMAAGRRVNSLYDLATFTTVRNCDLFKLEYRSLPNAVQCDIYRTVCILILSSYFFFALLPRQLMFTKFV